ncbi:MAG: cytochrome C [Gemmatimonadaceae bacterium]|nr:cytochrome C [Gemmatimonadaceae bacterium]NUO93576.1 cytochrome C [Gemmatimonadaceae bacterium]NUP71943.1 cytochrome C [Gemmatimonadaceae bacterium]NUR33213.1 cytochrome C [Gemmatimonadaceae bacterium]NUS32068.1 cytochrome C [Gemmatimonadaceae bacterium]
MRLRPHSAAFPLALLAACTMAGGGAAPATSTSEAMPPVNGPAIAATSMEQAGEYLTIVGGCNDCHTQGWSESDGKVAPADRLAGMNVGFRGPWGTSYGKNLRTIVQRQTEDRWVQVLTTADGGDGKPPMPWWNTRQMSDRDLRAMYRYIKSLGPKLNGVPRSLPPGKEPSGPYIWVAPQPPK